MSDILDNRVYLMQVGLKSLGFDPGKLDGDEGPKTKSAFDAWLASLVPASSNSIADAIVKMRRHKLEFARLRRIKVLASKSSGLQHRILTAMQTANHTALHLSVGLFVKLL